MSDFLSTPYALTQAQIDQFQRDGYIRLKEVLSPEILSEYSPVISEMVHKLNKQDLPLAERGTYGKAFLQITNIWEHSEKVTELVLARRLGQIAAELMAVKGVRLYHDQALFKEPSGGFTPWHADQFYWPLSNENSITAWIPLQPVPLEMGPLSFCVGSQKIMENRHMAISDDSEQQIDRSLKNYPKDVSAYDLGEVSFHRGWTFHRAGPNQTDQMRGVMTIIYMEDGMKVAQPKNASQQSDWDRWLPGAKLGEVIGTHLNPVVYRRDS
ncbi:MAG: phytanoyl-CoA dioxygenase family protein [Chloroflexota bacterium]